MLKTPKLILRIWKVLDFDYPFNLCSKPHRTDGTQVHFQNTTFASVTLVPEKLLVTWNKLKRGLNSTSLNKIVKGSKVIANAE